MTDPEIRPTAGAVPKCTREACPAYDGKRCRLTGFQPESVCEPAVIRMAGEIAAMGTENAGLLGTNHGLTRSEAFFRDRAEQLESAITTIADEAFGPFEVRPVGDNLTAIQQGIFEQRVELERFRSALEKISAIRDSIVGLQGFNFSEHAYPLVAALKAAGFEGAGYEIASKNLGTLLEQIKAAEIEIERLKTELLAARAGWTASSGKNVDARREADAANMDRIAMRRERDEARAELAKVRGELSTLKATVAAVTRSHGGGG